MRETGDIARYIGGLTEVLMDVLKNEDAVRLCINVWEAWELFDDAYDDKLSKDEVYRLLEITMVLIPNNIFYRTFRDKLQPIVELNIMNWHTSNNIEENSLNFNDKDHEKLFYHSYILRSFITQLFSYCVRLLHGDKYCYDNSARLQLLFNNTFEEYKRKVT